MSWLNIPGFPDYQISRNGVVRNLKTGRIFNGSPSGRRGYLRTHLKNKTGGYSYRSIHSLLLETFVGPRPNGFVGCHIDDNARNNDLKNLMWATPETNRAHAKANNRIPCAEKHRNSKLTERQVRDIRARYKRGGGPWGRSNTETLAKEFKVSPCTILRAANGYLYKTVSRYATEEKKDE